MGEVPEIKDFPNVIQPHLGNGQLVSYQSKYLTKPGENYGSLMLSVTARVKRPNGDIEELPLVAKLPPLHSELHWKIFQPERSCVTEIAAYKYLAAEIRQLQLDCGIKESDLYNGLPAYYGSRISLDPEKTIVDRDALLVLENLQTLGFKAGNRLVMYDKTHTQLILRETAKFHALTIALRIKKPEVFNRDVRPYFRRFNFKKFFTPKEIEDLDNETLYEIQLATNNNENLVERARELAAIQAKHFNSPDPEDGPFTVISHNDLWINNILLQYDENGAPKKMKIVDFQISDYDSVAHDIVFFFFSSVDMELLEENFDDFLKFYYKHFIECLERTGIDTKIYSYEGFMKEIERHAPAEIWHALFMVKVILADSTNLPEDFKDMDLSVNFNNNKGIAAVTKKCAQIIRLAQKLKYF